MSAIMQYPIGDLTLMEAEFKEGEVFVRLKEVQAELNRLRAENTALQSKLERAEKRFSEWENFEQEEAERWSRS